MWGGKGVWKEKCSSLYSDHAGHLLLVCCPVNSCCQSTNTSVTYKLYFNSLIHLLGVKRVILVLALKLYCDHFLLTASLLPEFNFMYFSRFVSSLLEEPEVLVIGGGQGPAGSIIHRLFINAQRVSSLTLSLTLLPSRDTVHWGWFSHYAVWTGSA